MVNHKLVRPARNSEKELCRQWFDSFFLHGTNELASVAPFRNCSAKVKAYHDSICKDRLVAYVLQSYDTDVMLCEYYQLYDEIECWIPYRYSNTTDQHIDKFIKWLAFRYKCVKIHYGYDRSDRIVFKMILDGEVVEDWK